ncbi:MAG TPA: TAXI family TRAP transporter solute-binding subunit, partial [Verrucomicrobiae bacterium]|nr:TAXI family TRAP transporter solute-binding subunit [Verrucomicrobiae bacterium]
ARPISFLLLMNSNDPKNPNHARERIHERAFSRVLSTFTELFGMSRSIAIAAVLFIVVVVGAAVFWSIHSAPPRTLIITSGPPGSSFERYAEQYRDLMASNGVTLIILPSGGSIENLKRLSDPTNRVDVGFVQTGESGGRAATRSAGLYSLGSIAHQPLWIFYRSETPVSFLSGFAGKKLAVGPPGSGTRALALTLLETNGITTGGTTTFLDLDSEAASKGLLDGSVDAVFLMGDSASLQSMKTLLHAPGVQLFDFVQADAYTRRFDFLTKLQLPEGSLDLGRNIPAHDVNLVGPTVQLVARGNLHPALCDLLLESARHVHGKPSLLQRRNEFPAPIEQEFRISDEATRFYNSGKRFLYRSLPFWLASLVNRVLVAFVPMVLLLVPGLKLIPATYKWRIQLHIYRWYRGLLRLERELDGAANKDELRKRLDRIEHSVNGMKVPASFASQFYSLRDNIGFVRERLNRQ